MSIKLKHTYSYTLAHQLENISKHTYIYIIILREAYTV